MYMKLNDTIIRTAVDREKADLFAAIMLRRLGGKANYMKLMKLLYFADRFHLRRFMRPIAKDDIFAMKKGIICSYWLDILRGVLNSRYFESDKVRTVKLKEDFAFEEKRSLSESEIEALEFALSNF